MRSFVFALLAFTVASIQLASAAATISDYRAPVPSGLAKADPRDANAETFNTKAPASPARLPKASPRR